MHSFKLCFGLKLIAIILVMVTVVSLIPRNLTAHGFDAETLLPENSDFVSAEDAENYSIVSRDTASEIDLNSLIFNTSKGEKVEFFYPYDIKYIDGEGFVHDKDTTIVRSENGFASEGTGVRISFPDKLSDGVSITSSDDKYSVSFSPLSVSENYLDGALDADDTTVRYEGLKESLEYGASYSGLKENIILNEYSGTSSWSFRLQTNGLSLGIMNGQYVLTDGDVYVMNFGSIIAFTADDKNNTFGEMTVETATESQEYILTVTVPEEWLVSEDTYYEVKSYGDAFSKSTVKQMLKYDHAKPLFSSRGCVKRGTQDVFGYLKYGGWDVYFYLYEPGLVVYKCEWNNARATTTVVVTVALAALITVATIATEGAAAPAYGLLFA